MADAEAFGRADAEAFRRADAEAPGVADSATPMEWGKTGQLVPCFGTGMWCLSGPPEF